MSQCNKRTDEENVNENKLIFVFKYKRNCTQYTEIRNSKPIIQTNNKLFF